MNKKRISILLVALILAASCYLTACSQSERQTVSSGTELSLSDIPDYEGKAYIAIDNNVPEFAENDFVETSFEHYSDLDALGRCGAAFANIGKDIMPTEDRGSIGQVKPAGWHTVKYSNVDGKYLYNRCHLVGYQLAAENANEKNLITGTRYLNVEGMLPFENLVADYVKETDNHVLYRVTPIYEGDNLLADGVQMEAESVEDKGKGVSFNVFVYNVQPGIAINYANGDSGPQAETGNAAKAATKANATEIRGNSNSKIYHCPGQAGYEKMAGSKNLVVFNSEKEAREAGYRKAKR